MANEQPIIIKKIKKGGGGHHGGAWKVAYADFVTAMMAFFLILWIINATSSEQKMGLAEFFTPTQGLKDSQGIGFKGGLKPSEAGRPKNDLTAVGMVAGQVKQGPAADIPNSQTGPSDPNAENAATAKMTDEVNQDTDQFKVTSQEIKQAIDQDPDLKEYLSNVVIQETTEGLKIDMIDDDKKPMFVPGGAVLTDLGKKVMDSMAGVISKTPNNIGITGHTDAAGVLTNPQYTNWELSSERALAARRFLSTTQLEPERVSKIVGMAGRELLSPQEPTSPRNRRVTILLIRNSYFRDPKTAATTRGLLTVPQSKPKKPASSAKAVVGTQPAPSETSTKPNSTDIFSPVPVPRAAPNNP